MRLGTVKTRFRTAFLPTLVAAFAVSILTPAAPAQAAVVCAVSWLPSGVVYTEPFLSTGYGPVSHGSKSGAWGLAQPGFYSPLTGTFSGSSGTWTSINNENMWLAINTNSSDGVVGKFCGGRSINTDYGAVIYGIQYNSAGTSGRWGNYNLVSSLFYSDGSGWLPIT